MMYSVIAELYACVCVCVCGGGHAHVCGCLHITNTDKTSR